MEKSEYEFLGDKTVNDIVDTAEFKKALLHRMNALDERRRYLSGHPIERLKSWNGWNVDSISDLYIQILNKECALSSRMRAFITILGNDAYVETIKNMKNETTDV